MLRVVTDVLKDLLPSSSGLSKEEWTVLGFPQATLILLSYNLNMLSSGVFTVHCWK